LSQSKIYHDIFDSEKESEMDHISLSRWCDIILFVPITANSIAKLATGRADDLASILILASNKQVILAPAMNVRMWHHKSTQSNMDKLLDFGYLSVGPSIGEMACGEYGEGKCHRLNKYVNF
jgi:phosphopantothenoylcysteine decarboxylase/phosphopantothenate--cysteine ligase